MRFPACVVVLFALLAAAPARAQAPLESDTLALVHVAVVDVRNGSLLRDRTVTVAGGHIHALDSGAAAPAGARVIDATGKYLIPGLWDTHVHLSKAGESALPLLVAHGVTSVRDMGGDFALVHGWRDEIARGARVGPRIRMAGPILEDADRVRRMRTRTAEPVARTRAGIAGPADAGAVVDSVARLGVDFLKVRTVASLETYRAIAAAARRHGLPLVGHARGIPPAVLLEAGQRSVEHFLEPPLAKQPLSERQRLYRQFVEHGLAFVPTTVGFYGSLAVPNDEARAVLADSLGAREPRRRYVSRELLADWREQLEERHGLGGWIARRYLARVRRGVLQDYREMHRAGVRIMPGTDLAVLLIYPGWSLHDELRHFVDVLGMSPAEALARATVVPAEFFGIQDSLGTIAPGKRADLVLLDANPLEDIARTRRIHAVVLGGRYLDRGALDALMAEAERAAAGPPPAATRSARAARP